MLNFNIIKHFASALAVVFFLFLAFGSDDDSNTDSNSSNNTPAKEEPLVVETPEERNIKLNEQLKRELETVNKPFDNSGYNGTVEQLQIAIILFGAWTNIINEGKSSSLEANVLLANELSSKVSKLQVEQFPILRKRYGKIIADKMWEHDIIIKTIGDNYTTLDFTGGTFAANKNIKDVQETLHDVLTMFRFKQTRYRWYKGADEYTYYGMNTPSDKEIAPIK